MAPGSDGPFDSTDAIGSVLDSSRRGDAVGLIGEQNRVESPSAPLPDTDSVSANLDGTTVQVKDFADDFTNGGPVADESPNPTAAQ